jgi:hypothetical protein
LFGARLEYRSAEDICPLLERLRDMKVKVIAIVSDKEKGLVPAIAKVFPDVPHQFCQTHFLKNCAKPLDKDLSALGVSVTSRGDKARKIGKRLHEEDLAASPVESPRVEGPLSEKELVQELCSIVHDNVRAAGKAPLNPPELVRHKKLEAVLKTAEMAREILQHTTPEPVAGTPGHTELLACASARRRSARPTRHGPAANREHEPSGGPRHRARRDPARVGP